MEEQDNPSKRKELEGDKLKLIIKEIRECKDCDFFGINDPNLINDATDLIMEFTPCPIHKEKIRELL
jgi:hypothetical protein